MKKQGEQTVFKTYADFIWNFLLPATVLLWSKITVEILRDAYLLMGLNLEPTNVADTSREMDEIYLYLDYPNRSRCRQSQNSRIHQTRRKILAWKGSRERLTRTIERKGELFVELIKCRNRAWVNFSRPARESQALKLRRE